MEEDRGLTGGRTASVPEAPKTNSPGASCGTARRRNPVRVIVVAYGSTTLLQTCLTTLEGRYPVVIVDNGCSTATREVARNAGADYVYPRRNIGFGAAVNLALKQLPLASCDTLLLNPDATISPSAVEQLRVALHEAPDIACVGPAQRHPSSERLGLVCWPFDTPGRAWGEAIGLARFRHRWDFIMGSILLVRGVAFLDVGGFDQGFFLTFEEADWQRRATERRWRICYCSHVVATHVRGGTEDDDNRRQLLLHAGAERYIRKWHGGLGWACYRLARVLTWARRAIIDDRRRPAHVGMVRIYAVGPYKSAIRAGVQPVVEHLIPVLSEQVNDPLAIG